MHTRLGWLGSEWHKEAARILHRYADTIRQEAYIWERLGPHLEAKKVHLVLGYRLLRAAAADRDPEATLAYFFDERMAGRSVMSLLREWRR
jgi:hypothetical protein